MKVGLYFGSFNPIHVGHVALSNYLLTEAQLDELWFVVTPHNPLKNKDLLIDDDLRLQMVNLAIADFPKLKACDVEFSLHKPSYTINTLQFLSKTYPENNFTLIIGADNLSIFPQWKEYQQILTHYKVLVYPRKGFDLPSNPELSAIEYVANAPQFDVSSTFIRENIQQGKEVSQFVAPAVELFIKQHKLYQ
jgi:nicotinate-nucleotide adenylyltransferase